MTCIFVFVVGYIERDFSKRIPVSHVPSHSHVCVFSERIVSFSFAVCGIYSLVIVLVEIKIGKVRSKGLYTKKVNVC